MKYKLPPPSQILESIKNGEFDFATYKKSIGQMRQKIAMQKSRINRSKRVTNKQQIIARLDYDFKTLGKYRERIAMIPEVVKTIGTGVYTQKREMLTR